MEAGPAAAVAATKLFKQRELRERDCTLIVPRVTVTHLFLIMTLLKSPYI